MSIFSFLFLFGTNFCRLKKSVAENGILAGRQGGMERRRLSADGSRRSAGRWQPTNSVTIVCVKGDALSLASGSNDQGLHARIERPIFRSWIRSQCGFRCIGLCVFRRASWQPRPRLFRFRSQGGGRRSFGRSSPLMPPSCFQWPLVRPQPSRELPMWRS